MVYRIPLHRTGKAIQFLLQAVLLNYIAKIQPNGHWDLNSLTLSIAPEHVFQYCTPNLAAGRRHIQSYYKSIAFYCAYVYRIAARIFNTYRIVRHAYRYTPIYNTWFCNNNTTLIINTTTFVVYNRYFCFLDFCAHLFPFYFKLEKYHIVGGYRNAIPVSKICNISQFHKPGHRLIPFTLN